MQGATWQKLVQGRACGRLVPSDSPSPESPADLCQDQTVRCDMRHFPVIHLQACSQAWLQTLSAILKSGLYWQAARSMCHLRIGQRAQSYLPLRSLKFSRWAHLHLRFGTDHQVWLQNSPISIQSLIPVADFGLQLFLQCCNVCLHDLPIATATEVGRCWIRPDDAEQSKNRTQAACSGASCGCH